MLVFPVERIRPIRCVLQGEPGNQSLIVNLEPFVVDDKSNDEPEETCFWLDGFTCLPGDLRECVGQVFEFPVNPADGYIDGSIYLQGSHHPANLTRLAFELIGETLMARLSLRVLLTHEGLYDANDVKYKDFDISLCVPVDRT